MITEQMNNSELDKLISNTLKFNDTLTIPSDLSEKTIRKLEKKILLRELMLELVFKLLLVLGSLTILTGVFVWMNGITVINKFYIFITDNVQIITVLLFIVFVIILIDQIILKFYYAYKSRQIY